MTESPEYSWESRLHQIAGAAAYPPTPDLWPSLQVALAQPARPAHRPRLAWAALALAALALGAAWFAAPTARAALYRVLRLGAIRIFVEPATATPARPTPAGTPSPTPGPVLRPPFDLEGLTSLDVAREALGPALQLPSYPEGIGEPDLVFVQDGEGPLAILVWLDPADPDRARWALYILSSGTFADKGVLQFVQETRVGPAHALWMVGPHILQLRNGKTTFRTLVSGNVLIWQRGDTSYRLETDGSMEEAVRVAESLQ